MNYKKRHDLIQNLYKQPCFILVKFNTCMTELNWCEPDIYMCCNIQNKPTQENKTVTDIIYIYIFLPRVYIH